MFFDQVIPDDLIVQGSACVGIDCVNNENFGFDTIRVKENNVRIQFDDTSVSAGFPTNTWQRTAFSATDRTASRATRPAASEVQAAAPASSRSSIRVQPATRNRERSCLP